MLDLLDSLVRKSLVTVGSSAATPGTGCWRRSASSPRTSWPPRGDGVEVRDRHAAYFAGQAIAHWEHVGRAGLPRSPSTGWSVEFANLRAGFRWAADHADLIDGDARLPPTRPLLGVLPATVRADRWVEEILPAAAVADVRLPHLPRLYTAGTLCPFVGHPDAAVAYADRAVALQD